LVDGAKELFLDVLARTTDRFGARIHGYALMSNHYHLMVEVPHGNLSRVMQFLSTTFTQAVHRRTGGDGPLFRGRYRNELVGDDAYWMHLLAYLHLNPVRAGLVAHPSASTWTSHRAYVGLTDTPAWLTTHELLGHFGSQDALSTYVRDAAEGLVAAPAGFEADGFWRASPHSQPRPAVPRLEAMEAVGQVARAMGVDDPLVRSVGRQQATGRRMSAWWLSQSTDLTMVAIGDVLGVSRPRARQLVQALHRQADDDEAVQSWMRRLMFPRTVGSR